MLTAILKFIIWVCALVGVICILFIPIGFFIGMLEHDKKVKRIKKNYKEFWGDEG